MIALPLVGNFTDLRWTCSGLCSKVACALEQMVKPPHTFKWRGVILETMLLRSSLPDRACFAREAELRRILTCHTCRYAAPMKTARCQPARFMPQYAAKSQIRSCLSHAVQKGAQGSYILLV